MKTRRKQKHGKRTRKIRRQLGGLGLMGKLLLATSYMASHVPTSESYTPSFSPASAVSSSTSKGKSSLTKTSREVAPYSSTSLVSQSSDTMNVVPSLWRDSALISVKSLPKVSQSVIQTNVSLSPIVNSVISNATQLLSNQTGVSTILNESLWVSQKLNNTKLNDCFIISPHNTATTISTTFPLTSLQLTTPNQLMNHTQLLQFAPHAGILCFDYDIGKTSDGTLTSKHGSSSFGGIGRRFNASYNNTTRILADTFNSAKANLNSIYMIRVENNDGVGASDFLNTLSPEHRSMIYDNFHHGKMPTYGDVTASGRNVIVMLQNDGTGLDPVTKNYIGGILPQSHFTIRTIWNKPNEITRNGPIEDRFMHTEWHLLPKNGNVFNFIDGYSSTTGTNVKRLNKQMQYIPLYTNTTVVNLGLTAARHNYTSTASGAVVMLDGVSPAMIVAFSNCNYNGHCNITQTEIEAMQGAAQVLRDQRGLIDGWVFYFKESFEQLNTSKPNLGLGNFHNNLREYVPLGREGLALGSLLSVSFIYYLMKKIKDKLTRTSPVSVLKTDSTTVIPTEEGAERYVYNASNGSIRLQKFNSQWSNPTLFTENRTNAYNPNFNRTRSI